MEEKIMNAAIEEFSEKGLKFTMDDVAKHLGISKKTLYKVFASKEDLLVGIADTCFRDIKKSEQEITDDPDMDIVTKIEKILIVLPEKYQNIGLSMLYQLYEKYPKIYKRVAEYLTTDWDNTIKLIQQGIEEGKIRPIAIPILKAMVESTIQTFMASDVLVENHLTYEKGMQEMVKIIMEGIKA